MKSPQPDPVHVIRLLVIAFITSVLLLAAPVGMFALMPDGDATWDAFHPPLGEWVTTIPVTSSIIVTDSDGLGDDAAYQTAIGGIWSDWQSDNLQISGAISVSRAITVTGLPLNEGLNLIRFRITDTLNNIHTSTTYPINVDTTAPPAPINPRPQPETWTNVDAFSILWENPSDVNGIGGAWYKIASAPTDPEDGAFVAGNNLQRIDGITVGTPGRHDVWIWLQDGVGNVDHSSAVTTSLLLDTDPPGPLSDLSVDPEGWTNINHFDLSWVAPADESGISGTRHRLGEPPAGSDDGDFWPNTSSGYDGYHIPGDLEGEHELWLWPVDGAGNGARPEDARSLMLRLDTTAPPPPLTVPVVTPSGWQTDTTTVFTVTWNNPSDMSGIAGACYKLGSQPTSDLDGTCILGEEINQLTDIMPSNPGSYHLFLWLQDAAGNLDKDRRQVALDAVQWDPVPPGMFVDVTGTQGENDWYIGAIAVSILASDVGSGLDIVEYQLDGEMWKEGVQLTIEEDGLHQMAARARDIAGNVSIIEPLLLNLDTEPPFTDLAFDRLPVLENWYDGPVTVLLSPDDETSGIDYVEWQLDDGVWIRNNVVDIDADGQHILRYYARDNAGNSEEIQSVEVHIDRTPPVTSYVILPGEPNEAGWFTTPVTVTLFPDDEGVGVAETLYRIDGGAWQVGTTFVLNDSGEHVVEFYSVDQLGHEEDPFSIPGGVRIDTDPPRAPTPLAVTPQVWTNTNSFRLTFAVPPDLSGIAGAYFKVGEPPTAPLDGTWRAGTSNVLNNVQVPEEGRFRAYVWLQDVAGNVDENRRGEWRDTLTLAYDATAPTTEALLDGMAGDNDWFVTPVRVRLVATDTLSGVASTVVSIDGSQPITSSEFILSVPDKHTINFRSRDQAGNVEDLQLETVRIDPVAPSSPQAVSVSPLNWTQVNNFTVTWINPPDTSGIAGGYVKVGAPPTHGRDGVRIPPVGISSGITVPAEGAWDMHFWLIDHAGNTDLSTRAIFPKALRFDSTPPTTVADLQGTLAPSGWYTSPVTIQLSAEDLSSGVDVIRYRINGAPWQESTQSLALQLQQTGTFEVEYQAVDHAGNVESLHRLSLRIDVNAPWPFFSAASRYTRATSFVLSWQGTDQPQGSGLWGFDLQSRDGRNGAWVNWGSPNVPDTSGRFYGSSGHRYYFRMRARDRAGNLSAWVQLPWGVYVERIPNGDFGTKNLDPWQPSGPLPSSVIDATGPTGALVSVARLGSPDYGPNVPGKDIPDDSTGTVPVGPGRIRQVIRVPGADVLERPALTFWYRIFTYDTAFGQNQQQWFDTLDLQLEGPTGRQLRLRDGLPYDDWIEGELSDLGWKYAFIPLPPSWSGETMTVDFENWNRIDGRLNTWSFVTDVRLWEPYHTFIPQVLAGPSSGLQAPLPAVDPSTRKSSSGLR